MLSNVLSYCFKRSEVTMVGEAAVGLPVLDDGLDEFELEGTDCVAVGDCARATLS